LVESCVDQLVGGPGRAGHYFTIWAPRQAGKTWLTWQAKEGIESRFPDRFVAASMSMQGVVMKDDEPAEVFLESVPRLMWEAFDIELERPPKNWRAFTGLFRDGGVFETPLILFIDEFDSLPRPVIDQLVVLFRDMYLKREHYLLHGLALIGVRAVLGVESQRGSPFNVQRSRHIPNLSQGEVTDLFRQYEQESGQHVEPTVVDDVYRATRGQPGLVGWFGELLTEKYNTDKDGPIDARVWANTYRSALNREWNNTVLNLVKKARGEYLPQVLELFGRADIPFRLDVEWCNYLYLNGVIDADTQTDGKGDQVDVCRFSSPFVQERLYNALTGDLTGDRTPILALEPLDRLDDVFEGDALDLPALLERYQAYLIRLATRGIDPWQEQPRRADLHLTEAVGHFHLYAWLQAAIGRRCVVSPEFPTGNGKVDLHLRCGDKRGVIEVKSFVDLYELDRSREQAARYAGAVGLDRVTLVVFVPSKDENVLNELSGETEIDGVRVMTVAVGWGEQ